MSLTDNQQHNRISQFISDLRAVKTDDPNNGIDILLRLIEQAKTPEGGSDGNDSVKIDETDSTSQYLLNKLNNSGNVQFSVVDTAGNKSIKADVPIPDELLAIDDSLTATTTKVVDSFAGSLSNGAEWSYTLKNDVGTIVRSGRISACWNDALTSIEYVDEHTADIGVVDLDSVSVVINVSDIELVIDATNSAEDWEIKAKRILI